MNRYRVIVREGIEFRDQFLKVGTEFVASRKEIAQAGYRDCVKLVETSVAPRPVDDFITFDPDAKSFVEPDGDN